MIKKRSLNFMKDHDLNSNYDIGLIGFGPSVILFLDELFRVLEKQKAEPLSLVIINKTKDFGSGIHETTTPRHARLNRIAGQIALSSRPGYECRADPSSLSLNEHYSYSFLDWAKKKYELTNNEDYNMDQSHWPPRYMLGEALKQQAASILNTINNSPEIMSVTLVHGYACSVSENNNNYIIEVCDKRKKYINITAKNVIFSNGTIKEDPVENIGYIEPYPLQNIVSTLQKSSNKVLVEGGGATGVDVINTLFLADQNNKVVAITRTGSLCHARPINEKLNTTSFYENILFNEKMILAVLRLSGKENANRLLFDLLILECLIANAKYLSSPRSNDFLSRLVILSGKNLETLLFNTKRFIKEFEEIVTEFFIREVISENPKAIRYKEKLKVYAKQKSLSFNQLISKISFNPFNYLNDCYLDRSKFKSWRDSSKEFILFDLFNAKCGNLTSMFKFMSDGVFRDGRINLMKMLDDYSKLSEQDFLVIHSFTTQKFLPIHNRIADGSPIESIEPLVDKVKKNQLQIFREADIEIQDVLSTLTCKTKDGDIFEPDIYIKARNPTHKGKIEGVPLLKDLLDCGRINEYKIKTNYNSDSYVYNAGIKLDCNFNPISSDEKPQKNIFFLGASAEGSRQFNHTLGRPDTEYPVIRNIKLVVEKLSGQHKNANK